jgi:hypothetical protein
VRGNDVSGDKSSPVKQAPQQHPPELIHLVERLQTENAVLRERLNRRRCGACGAIQQWRDGDAGPGTDHGNKQTTGGS